MSKHKFPPIVPIFLNCGAETSDAAFVSAGKRLLISGSCFEYSNKKILSNEKDICEPSDHFTRAKLSLLLWLSNNNHKLKFNFLWFRIFYAYGPYQRKESIIPYLIRKLKKNKFPKVNNPYISLDFIHIEDIAKYFISAVNKKFKSGVYNLGNSKGIKIIKILEHLEMIIFKKQTPMLYKKYINNSNQIKTIFTADMTKSKIFKIKNQITIKEGLKKTVDEY